MIFNKKKIEGISMNFFRLFQLSDILTDILRALINIL